MNTTQENKEGHCRKKNSRRERELLRRKRETNTAAEKGSRGQKLEQTGHT